MAGKATQVFLRCGNDGRSVVLDIDLHDTPTDVHSRLLGRLLTSRCFPTSGWWLEHQGRPWSQGVTARQQGLRSGSVLQLHLRLRGGGGDGGSTGAESRSSYLEMYQGKKHDKVNPAEELRAKWTTCRLSGLPLVPPCCVDELGYIFNKEAVLQALMEKSMPKALSHISSLKHVRDLQLTPSGEGEGARGAAATARNFQPGNEADFACPITGLEMNGKYRFVVLRKSGHVISEKALKQCPTAVEEHVGYKWAPSDVLPLNGTPEEVEALRDALLEQRAAVKAKKSSKKKGVVVDNAMPSTELHPVAAKSGPVREGAIGVEERGARVGGKRGCDVITVDEKARVKQLKETLSAAPEGASQAVWASIFNSSSVERAETYACRGNFGALR